MSYGGPLKYKTVQMVKLGPFVSATTGGYAIQSGLTLTKSNIRVSKYNSKVFAAKNHAKGAYHMYGGWYWASVDGTDTNTFGEFTISCSKSGALPVERTYTVKSRPLWNQFVGSIDNNLVLNSVVNDATRIDGSRINTCSSFDRDGLRLSIFTNNRRANLSVGGTIDATSQASSATSTLDRSKIRSALLTDNTRFAGANIDIAISSRATLDRDAVRDAVVSTIDRSALLATLIDDGTRLDGSRLNTCSTVDRQGISASVASTADRTAMRTSVWSDGTNIAGASMDYVVKNVRHQEIAQVNQLIIYDQTGSADLYTAGGVKINTIAAAFTSTSKTRTRKRMVVN